MVKQAAEFEMPALALTDHGVMYGVIPFYEACKSAGIKPILGCEVYLAPRSRTSRSPKLDAEQHHLVLLAENNVGYRNLLKLVSIGYTEGFYYKPRVDKELLATHSQGLIALTGCLAGEVPRLCLAGETAKAEQAVRTYQEIFGRDSVYLELQDQDLPDQKESNAALCALSARLGVPVVATNDVHYMKQKDASAHDVLLCIQTGATVDDPDRLRFGSREFFMKSPKQMAERFGDVAGAMENTLEVAARCSVEIDFSRLQLPEIEVPDGMDEDSCLADLAWQGLRARSAECGVPNAECGVPNAESGMRSAECGVRNAECGVRNAECGMANAECGTRNMEAYENRLRYELETIKTCGFPRYLLIVRDFAQFARDREIFMGVRGSAAGSLVCYCLGITDFDPIEYGLTFERFLNIERVEMPDIDMDFQDDRRDEVIRYVVERYGEDRVAQIVTFGTLAARAAVRDAGRALGVNAQLVDRVCKTIPTIPVGITIERALRENPEFAELYKSQEVRDLVDTARQLEGISRHASTHAAGVIISHDPLTEHVPIQKGGKGEILTQYDADSLKKIGLLKMDFLGLANLTILARCVENIRKSRGIEIDVHSIPLDDSAAFEMLGRGETTGVFQLEGSGMRRNIQDLKPNSVGELAAMVALYRPGPMAHIPKFIRSKFGQEPISYPHPSLAPILEETYGVIVYQDQVLLIVQAIAGFTLGQADVFRRAMGKKKKDEMKKQREAFLAGAKENDVPEKKAVEIFDLIEPFAGYAFNKAHAVCYAHLAYQTAHLKAHFPVEYMAALLDAHIDNKDKVGLYIEECRRLKVAVLPPDINESEADFCVEGGGIRFGLAAIKNCGKGVVEAIIEARRSKGPFRSLQDFCERVLEGGQIGKSAVEVLIRAGAFGSIVSNRRQALGMLDEAMARATAAHRDKRNGQAGLFAGSVDRVHEMDPRKYADIEEFPREELLATEKDLLGLYVSDHPLTGVRAVLEREVTVTADQLQELSDAQECVVGGVIADLRYHMTKKSNERMAFVRIEDLTGPISVTVFPSVFRQCAEQLLKDRVVIVRGKASHRERIGRGAAADEERGYQVEVVAESLKPLSEVMGDGSWVMENGAGGRGPGVGGHEAEAVKSHAPCPMTHDPPGPAPDTRHPTPAPGSAVHIRISPALRAALGDLRAAIDEHPGELPVFIHVPNGGHVARVHTVCCVAPSEQFLSAVRGIVGPEGVWVE